MKKRRIALTLLVPLLAACEGGRGSIESSSMPPADQVEANGPTANLTQAELGVSAPSPSPVTQPPSPFTERFDSPLHGLSIGYPSGWQTRVATEPWGHGDVAFDAPDVDVIFDPTFREDVYIAMVSEPLGGKSARDWVTGQMLGLSSVGICPDRPGLGGGGGDDTFHGDYAWFWGCDEPHGASGSVVMVGTATRGYIIYFHVANDRLKATFDTHWFERVLLKTVDLRPEDALDALNPSESP